MKRRAGRFQQPEEGHGHGALAAARLTHESKLDATLEVEGDTVNRFNRAILGVIVEAQVPDLEYRPVVHTFLLSRGLASSSRPDDTRKSPTKRRTMMETGVASHHHMPRSIALNEIAQKIVTPSECLIPSQSREEREVSLSLVQNNPILGYMSPYFFIFLWRDRRGMPKVAAVFPLCQ